MSRPLTAGERALAEEMFGDALAYDAVRIHRRRWWPLQPANVAMAPDGHLWVPPDGGWPDDFASAGLPLQALFIHELTHVWQSQRGGRWFLPLARHPFCRYRYALMPDKPFRRYGIEQQAMIVEHAWRARAAGRPDTSLEALLPFSPLSPRPPAPGGAGDP